MIDPPGHDTGVRSIFSDTDVCKSFPALFVDEVFVRGKGFSVFSGRGRNGVNFFQSMGHRRKEALRRLQGAFPRASSVLGCPKLPERTSAAGMNS